MGLRAEVQCWTTLSIQKHIYVATMFVFRIIHGTSVPQQKMTNKVKWNGYNLLSRTIISIIIRIRNSDERITPENIN